MTRLFDEREHAAENLFAHDEELRFLAHRRAIQSLGAWAAECLALDAAAAAAYADTLVGAFIAGTPEASLVARVQTDLERAGKPALSTNAGAVLAQATAQATTELQHGRADPRVEARQGAATHHHSLSASLGWRD